MFGGMELIPSPWMRDLVQQRTNKNKRINKKWAKKYGFDEVPWQKVYTIGDKIMAHPKVIDQLTERLQ
jgi:sporulation protein YlmC with PRC-barrel domain